MAEATASEAPSAALYTLDSGLTTLRSAAVSASGTRAVTFGVSVLVFSLTVWDLRSQTQIRTIETGRAPMSVRFTEDETAIVAALLSRDDHSAEVRRWEVSGSDDEGEVLYWDEDAGGIAISRDSATVVLRGRRSGLTILDVATGHRELLSRSTLVERIAVAPSGSIVVANTSHGMEAYRRTRGTRIEYSRLSIPISNPEPVQSMDCSADTIVTATEYSVSSIYPTIENSFYETPQPVRRLALSTSGGLLAVAHKDAVMLIDMAAKVPVGRLPTDSPVVRLTFSLDDTFLITAHEDNMARVWEVPRIERPATKDEAAAPAEPDAVRYGQEPVGSDFYTLIDTAGYAAYAEAITRAIQHDDTRPPLTIGIKGSWGAGKTSLMRMVQEALEWPAGQPSGSGPLRPIELTPKARDLTALEDTSAGELEPVRNGTVFRRLRALRRRSADVPAQGPAEQEKIEASPRPDGRGADPDDSAWRPTVWFNPWMYQDGEQVWAGLAYEIIKQITERMSVPERENFWLRLNLSRIDEQAVRRKVYGLIVDRLIPWAVGALVCVAVGLALLAVHLSRWFTVSLAGGAPVLLAAATAVQSASVLKSRVSGSLAQLVQPMGAVRQFTGQAVHGAYDELVSSPDYLAKAGFFYFVHADVQRVLDLVATGRRPLVVFVDDLDRCSPGTVVQVIEAINLFLAGDYPNSIFVIAMEPAMVAAHIEAAYSGLAEALADTGPSALGWRFLEKIVQLPLALPAMAADRKSRYIELLFNGTAPAAPAAAAQAEPAAPAATSLAQAVQTSQSLSGPASPAQARAIRQIIDRRLSEDSAEVGAVIDFAAPHLAANPREIKRFVNLFRFLVMIDSERGLQNLPSLGDLRAIAKVAVLHLRWPDLLALLGQLTPEGTTYFEWLEISIAQRAPGPFVDVLTEAGLSVAAARRLTTWELWSFLNLEPEIGDVIRNYL
jgi:KAP-like P-loop domain-containing protein